MSDIPKAREALNKLCDDIRLGRLTMDHVIARIDTGIMPLLFRVRACRRAPGKRHIFTEAEKREVKRMVRDNPDLTMHDIAQRLRIRNGGRVSNIMHNQR